MWLRAQDLLRPELGPPPSFFLLSVKMLMREKIFLCHKNKDHTRVSGPSHRRCSGSDKNPLENFGEAQGARGPTRTRRGTGRSLVRDDSSRRSPSEKDEEHQASSSQGESQTRRRGKDGGRRRSRDCSRDRSRRHERRRPRTARANALRRRSEERDQAHDRVEVSRRSTSASVITRIIILVGGMRQG